MPKSPDRSAAQDLRQALVSLRVGTEVLRTGGRTTLTASQCNALLDEFERLDAVIAELREYQEQEEALRSVGR